MEEGFAKQISQLQHEIADFESELTSLKQELTELTQEPGLPTTSNAKELVEFVKSATVEAANRQPQIAGIERAISVLESELTKKQIELQDLKRQQQSYETSKRAREHRERAEKIDWVNLQNQEREQFEAALKFTPERQAIERRLSESMQRQEAELAKRQRERYLENRQNELERLEQLLARYKQEGVVISAIVKVEQQIAQVEEQIAVAQSS